MSWRPLHLFAIPGNTYTCSGLSPGNIASLGSKERPTNPKEAALQVLALCELLDGMGVATALLPPHERPHLATLRQIGFSGADKEVLRQCHKESPTLLRHVSSASSMWMANSATFTPSLDSLTGKAHLTCANTITKMHRSLEAPFNALLFKKFFRDSHQFIIHEALPHSRIFSDEGSANHMRLSGGVGLPGLHLFVYGSKALEHNSSAPARFLARQSYEASRAVARLHSLTRHNSYFVQQLPASVDKGVFHNDLVACYNDGYLLIHQDACLGVAELIDDVKRLMEQGMMGTLRHTMIGSARLSIQEALQSYLFNSLIVTLPDGNSALVATEQCREHSRSKDILDELVGDSANDISNIQYVDLSQSMLDGGGPACLQLRLTLSAEQWSSLHQPCLVNKALLRTLRGWVEKHYRDRLTPGELADPALLEEGRVGLDELTQLLQLGALYPFQQKG